MSKVTVVVPIYNVEKYVHKCIESICSQMLTDIEIILVDDGSTDESGQICDKYAERDERIVVIHKANEGLSSARNEGIRISSSPYIMFVDGDDWVEPEFCSIPYNVAVETGSDLVCFLYDAISTNGEEKIRKQDFPAGYLTEEQAMYINVYRPTAAWFNLYNRDLFMEINYPVGKYYEDVGTSHKLVHEATRIYFINSVLYNHRIGRPGSITTNPGIKGKNDFREMTALRVKDLFAWKFDEYAVVDAFQLMINYGSDIPELHRYLQRIKSSPIPRYLELKRKILFECFKLSPRLFDLLCVCYGKR